MDWAGEFSCSGDTEIQHFSAGAGGCAGGHGVLHSAAFAIAAANSARYDFEGRIMIRLNHVSRFYPSRAEAPGGIVRALDDFTLLVEPGEWIAVMGPSGSGKSTLVNLIGCLDRASAGEILLDGQDISKLSTKD